MAIQRLPIPALRPFVALLWADDAPAAGPATREHVLPTGLMHLVFREAADDARLFDSDDDLVGHALPDAVVGGARDGYYVRQAGRPWRSAGVVLRPGAATLLLGVPAGELAQRHTALADLWGARAEAMRAELLACADPQRRLDRLEDMLIARLPRVRAMHPAVAQALDRLPSSPSVTALVTASGISHRQFIALFRGATGLAPKAFLDVLRFQRALLATAAGKGLADAAAATGYSDQAHLSRDFRAHAGIPPAAYLRLAPSHPNHLPVAAGQIPSRQGGTAR